MASEVDQQIERAREAMARIADRRDTSERPLERQRSRSRKEASRRLRTVAVANAAIVAGAVVIGLIHPLGLFGALLVLVLMIGATLAIAAAPRPRPVAAEKLRAVDLRVLPAQTGRWLESQRGALPVAARGVADRIGTRLDILAPQLGTIVDDGETGLEIRRLIGEQLPAFVADYMRVPPTLRTAERNGRTPDSELIAGLTLIEEEIGELTQRLAQPNLDTLETRGRFLEMKYRNGADA